MAESAPPCYTFRMGDSQATTGVIFDLDGTLVDSVYHHVDAWFQAFAECGVEAPRWRLHRRIGMGGPALTSHVLGELGHARTDDLVHELIEAHARLYLDRIDSVQPTAGANELLAALRGAHIPHAVASSGRSTETGRLLELLDLGDDAVVVTGDQVDTAKPHPEILVTTARRLDTPVAGCVLVGDAVWDMVAARRAGMVGVGLECGGRDRAELARALAVAVFQDPADLHAHLDELGLTT